MRYLSCFFLSCILVFGSSAQASAQTTESLFVVVDAGSTGSRIHVYSAVQERHEGLPQIQEIYKQKDGAPLASFADKPEQAGETLKALLTNAETAIRSRGFTEKNQIPLYVYSTAGMRLLPENKAEAINQSVKEYITQNYPFFSQGGVEVRTIAGSEEAFFAWVSVNEAATTLGLDSHQTVGIVEMGGASSQIAFTVDYAGQDVFSFELNGHNYHVLSKSFLGVGQDAAIAAITTPFCYSEGAPLSQGGVGHYNYEGCRIESKAYLNAYHIQQEVGALPSQSLFYGLSAFYYTFNFFNIANGVESLNALKEQATSVCGHSWADLQNSYPKEKPTYLRQYCFGGAYYYTLLHDVLGFSSTSSSPALVIVPDKINNRTVEWAEGVVAAQYLDLE